MKTKKHYEQPKAEVFELKMQGSLLAGSATTSIESFEEESNPFGDANADY